MSEYDGALADWNSMQREGLLADVKRLLVMQRPRTHGDFVRRNTDIRDMAVSMHINIEIAGPQP